MTKAKAEALIALFVKLIDAAYIANSLREAEGEVCCLAFKAAYKLLPYISKHAVKGDRYNRPLAAGDGSSGIDILEQLTNCFNYNDPLLAEAAFQVIGQNALEKMTVFSLTDAVYTERG